jgi:hypothetical protein
MEISEHNNDGCSWCTYGISRWSTLLSLLTVVKRLSLRFCSATGFCVRCKTIDPVNVCFFQIWIGDTLSVLRDQYFTITSIIDTFKISRIYSEI